VNNVRCETEAVSPADRRFVHDYPVGDVKEPGSTAESEGEDVFNFSWRNGDGCCRDMAEHAFETAVEDICSLAWGQVQAVIVCTHAKARKTGEKAAVDPRALSMRVHEVDAVFLGKQGQSSKGGES